MPKRSTYTEAGRRFLRPRFTKGPRPLPKPPKEMPPNVVISSGVLNEPESMIYRALTELGIAFIPQDLRGGRALGGIMMDFFILPPYPPIDLDYKGPFHFGVIGEVRDFWRDVERKRLGIERRWITYWDVYGGNLKPRILEILGAPHHMAWVGRG